MYFKAPVYLLFILFQFMTNPPRKLLVFATGDCTLLYQQVAIFSEFKSGMVERDIVIEQFCQNKENKNKFTSLNIPSDSSFTLILIGKDGGEKFRSYKPVSAKDIFDMVDVMPMRRQEIKSNHK